MTSQICGFASDCWHVEVEEEDDRQERGKEGVQENGVNLKICFMKKVLKNEGLDIQVESISYYEGSASAFALILIQCFQCQKINIKTQCNVNVDKEFNIDFDSMFSMSK